jgi:hypothetical protein
MPGYNDQRFFVVTGLGAKTLVDIINTNNFTGNLWYDAHNGIPYVTCAYPVLGAIKKLLNQNERRHSVHWRIKSDLKPLGDTYMRTAKETFKKAQEESPNYLPPSPMDLQRHARVLAIRAEIDVNLENGVYHDHDYIEPDEDTTNAENPLTDGHEIIRDFQKSVLEPRPEVIETVAEVLGINAADPQGPPPAENRGGPPEPVSNAGDVVENPTQNTPEKADEKVYRAWGDFYDLLAGRAVTPERADKAKKDGKPIKQAYTIAEDTSQGMPRGRYLPVYSNNTLWLHLLRPTKPIRPETLNEVEGPLCYSVVVGTEVFFAEGLHQIQYIQPERWKVVAK